MARVPSVGERIQRVRQLVLRPGAAGGTYFNLTLKQVYCLSGLGIIGSQDLESGWIDEEQLIRVEPQQSRDARFCYWDLRNGEYLFQCNEAISLGDQEVAILRPSDQLLASGGTHPIVCLSDIPESLLIPVLVSAAGLRVLKNASFSRIIVASV